MVRLERRPLESPNGSAAGSRRRTYRITGQSLHRRKCRPFNSPRLLQAQPRKWQGGP